MNRTIEPVSAEPGPAAPFAAPGPRPDAAAPAPPTPVVAPRRTADRVRTAITVIVVLVFMAGPAVFIAVRATQGEASFADTQEIGVNELSAAEIDIAVGERSAPILGRAFAPGDTRRGTIEFTNRGTVGLRYSVGAGEVEADASRIAEYMTWTVFWSADAATCPTRPPVDALVTSGTAMADGVMLMGDRAFGTDAGDRVLGVGQSDLLCLSVSLAFDIPNSLQAQSLTQPLIAYAEQLTDTLAGES